MAKLILPFLLFVAISGCSDSPEMAYSKHYTMSQCLEFIEAETGLALQVYTDGPKKVNGKLSNGHYFGCEYVDTGTQGVIFEGVYFYDSEPPVDE